MRRILMRAALILTVVALAMTGCAYAAEWVELTAAKETYIIAASADGTRFLMAEAQNYVGDALACRAYLTDADGRGETELYLADSDLVETVAQLYLNTLGISAEAGDALISEYGEAGFALMFLPWRHARLVAAEGDSMLVYFYGYNGYVLIDASIGKATLLDSSWAGLAPDGRLATCDALGACAILNPADDSTTPIALGDAKEWVVTNILPRTDGGFVAARRSSEQTGVGVGNFGFAYIGADGATAQAVSACAYSLGEEPDTFFYSEASDVGIACSSRFAAQNPPLIFRAGDETARVLWMDGADAKHAREVAFSDVLGEKGALAVDASCLLMPFGITRDGRSALIYELNGAALYMMDLETLALTTVATDAELSALFAQRETNYQGSLTISLLGWNGGDSFAGWAGAPGCALKLGLD